MAKKLKIYNGSSWEDVTFAITPPNTSVTNTFNTNQVIDASTSVAALRVTQRGTGEAFRVEDSTNPDSSPFVIDAAGQVYVGSVNAASKIPSTRQYLNIGGTGGSGVIQLLDAGNTGTLAGLIEFHDLLNTSNSGGTRNAYIAAFVDGTTTANNRGGRLDFATKQDGVSNAAVPRMTINNDGNIGVGTTSPTFVNTNYSGIHINASSGTSIKLTNTTSGQASTDGFEMQLTSGNDGYLWNRENASLVFGTNAVERVRITSDGLVTFDGTGLISRISGVNKFEVQSGAVKIWAGRNGAAEGGEMYLANSGGANSYSNTNDAVFDWYDGLVRISPDGFNKIYMLRPANDSGTAIGLRNVTASTSNPSGGQDGDMWATYV